MDIVFTLGLRIRIEHITINRLHYEMKLVSLEQRRQMQCLNLMFRLSKKETYVQKPNVNTRGNVKIKFRLMNKCTSKYLGSPLYRGSAPWDNLDKNVQTLPNAVQFSKVLSKQFTEYKDLLN